MLKKNWLLCEQTRVSMCVSVLSELGRKLLSVGETGAHRKKHNTLTTWTTIRPPPFHPIVPRLRNIRICLFSLFRSTGRCGVAQDVARHVLSIPSFIFVSHVPLFFSFSFIYFWACCAGKPKATHTYIYISMKIETECQQLLLSLSLHPSCILASEKINTS